MTTNPEVQVHFVHRPDLIICVDSRGIPHGLLDDLEADLRQEFQSYKSNPTPFEVAEKEWCLIACLGVEPVACKRGYVISRKISSQSVLYNVFLCDYGELKQYKKENVFPLSTSLQKLSPGYFAVVIDTIKPPSYSKEGLWPQKTYIAARGWVEKHGGRIRLLSELPYEDGICHLGDLCLVKPQQQGRTFLSNTYSSYLVEEGLAEIERNRIGEQRIRNRMRSKSNYQGEKETGHRGNLNASRKNSGSSTSGGNVNGNSKSFCKQNRQFESTGASIGPSCERNPFVIRPPSVSSQASGSSCDRNPLIRPPSISKQVSGSSCDRNPLIRSPSISKQVSGLQSKGDIPAPRKQPQPGQRSPNGAVRTEGSHGTSLQGNEVLTQTKVINKYHYPSAIRNQSDSGQEASPQNSPQVPLTTLQNSKTVDSEKDTETVAEKVTPGPKEDPFENLDDADLYVDEVEPFDPTKVLEVGESKPTGKTRMLNFQSTLYNIMSQGNLKTAFKPQASPVSKKANLFERIKDPDGCFENVYNSAGPTDTDTCQEAGPDSHSFVVAPVLFNKADLLVASAEKVSSQKATMTTQIKRPESMNSSDVSFKTGESKFKSSSDGGSSSSSSKAKSTSKISRFGQDSHLPNNPFYVVEVPIKNENENGKMVPSGPQQLVTTNVASSSSGGKPHRSPFKSSLPQWKETGIEADSKPSCTSDTESSLSTLSEFASPVDSDPSSPRNLNVSSTSGVGSSGEGNVSTSSDGNESLDVMKNSTRAAKANGEVKRRSFIPSASLGTWEEKTKTCESSQSIAFKGAIEEKEVMKAEEAIVSQVCAEIIEPLQASTKEEPTIEGTSAVDSIVVAMPIEEEKHPLTDPEVLKKRLQSVIRPVFLYAEDLSLVAEPYASTKDFPLWHFVESGLLNNKLLPKFNSLQRNIIPSLMRGSNVIIADNENTGKSLAYMIPVVAKVMEHCNSIKKQVKGPVPPRAVILTGCVAHGNKVWQLLDCLLDSPKNKQTTGYMVIQNDEKTREELQRGADILITTPEVLNEMMDKYLPYFSFEGLMYFIVDDTEILMRSKLPVLAQLLKTVQHGLMRLGPREIPIQYIFCGDNWSEAMEQSMGIVDNPVIVLGPMQAVAFGGVKIQVSYAKDQGDKLKQLLDLMSEVTKSKETTKVIVFCKSNESLRLVQSEMSKNLDVDVSVIMHNSVDGGSTWSPGIIQARKKWEEASPGSVHVLLCTDEVVRELGIVNATRVVHFDTAGERKNFSLRFTTMWWWFRSKQEQEKLKCGLLVSNVFVTPDEDDLDRLVAKLKEIGAAIPQKLEDDLEQMKQSQEKGLRLCPALLWFGFCDKVDPRKCQRRHQLLEDDVQLKHMIPTFGQIEVRIAKTVSMSTYIVQLLRHFEVKGGKAKLVTHYEEMLKDRIDYLEKYYGSADNKVSVGILKPGDYCAVWDDSRKIYLRAKVEDTKIPIGCAEYYRLHCLDTGNFVQRTADQVYVLPEEYDRLPNLCVEMIVANMKPPLGERSYLMSHRGIANKLTEHKVLVGRICLSLGQRIWVDTLKEMTSDTSGKPMVRRSLRRELFNRKYAEDNPDHMKTLYELCEQAGYSCRLYEHLLHDEFDAEFYKEFHQQNDPIQWAHLPICSKGNLETSMVWTSYIIDPDRFVCYQKKFTEQLDELVAEINNEIAQLVASNKYKNDYALKQYYQTEMVVAVKDHETNRWMRALITYINQDDDMLFNVLLVDIGEELYDVSMSNLHPLPSKFVSRLPFQAITISLSHICQRGEEGVELCWGSEAYALTDGYLFKESKESTVAEIAAYSRLETSGRLYGNEYAALVFAKDDELGEKLVKAGFADESVEWKEKMEKLRAALLKMWNQIIDQSLAVGKDSSGSGEDDLEDVNIPAEPSVENDDEDGLDKWDFVCDSYLNPMETFLGIDMKAPPVQHVVVTDPNLTRSKESSVRIEEVHDEESTSTNAVFPLEKLDGPLKKPKTAWKEVRGGIVLSLELADVKHFNVKVTDKRRLWFKTIDPEGYGFEIDLLRRVEEDVEVLPLGLRCEIRLKKRLPKLKWDRLTRDEKKRRWLRRECNFGSSESDDDDSSSDNGANLHRCKPKQRKALKEKRSALVPVDFDDCSSSSDAVDVDGVCDLHLE